MQPPRLLPPHYFVFSLVTMIALRIIETAPLFGGSWYLIGLLPLILGLGIALWGVRLFAKVGTNIVPFTESTALVIDGAFAYSRNPMYLGMVLVLLGVALLLDRASPWLVLVPFILVIRLKFIQFEEPLMEQTFGEDYVTYKSSVRRWL
ncbi:MAG: methyltransferase [Proteobacteria bacterium]|nr:methyltransferase [Pseudomonadota bacterium]